MRSNSKPNRTKLTITLHTKITRRTFSAILCNNSTQLHCRNTQQRKFSFEKPPSDIKNWTFSFQVKKSLCFLQLFSFSLHRKKLSITRVVLLSMNFHRVPRDVSQGSIPQLTPFPICAWLVSAVSSQQVCRWPQTGEEELSSCWRILLLIRTSRRMGFQKVHKASPAFGKEQPQDRCPGS